MRMKKRLLLRKDQRELILLTIPGILLLFFMNYVPMGGAVIAFKQYNPNAGIWGSEWIGFKNFEYFFSSLDAWRISRNTIAYALVFRVVGTIAAIALAMMFFEVTSKKALKFYQTVAILPHFLSWAIVGYITYAFLNPASGVLNSIVESFGGESIDWYAKKEYWPVILTVVNTWKCVGMDSMIYYAALMAIDTEMLEAAKLDGVSKWQEIWYIKLPSIAPVISILTILGLSNIFRGDFGLFYQIPRNVGLLYPATDIVDTYIYRGLENANIGITSAVGLFQSLVGLVLVLGTNAIVRKIDPEKSLF